jgi:hypothetical protein
MAPGPSMILEPQRRELRRYPRVRVSWPAIVETGNRLLRAETVNVSAFGAKVRLDEPLTEGTLATLHLEPPQGRPLGVQAIVWRTDADGPAFFFIEPTPAAAPASS